MKRALRSHGTTLLVASTLTSAGCSDANVCTLEARTAVIVQVEYTQDLEPDSVMATRRSRPLECTRWDHQEAGAKKADASDIGAAVSTYHCREQGGGEYVVRVVSGNLSWTQSVDIAANECHTIEQKELRFVLDPSDAD
jgi:hypothetical protein